MVSPYIVIEQYGKGCFIHNKGAPSAEDFSAAGSGLARATEVMLSRDYDIVVLDEILTACHFRLVPQESILELMKHKPAGLELVLTGRHAPEEIIEKADLVTEMREIKHYFHKGVPARTGIER
jgi:cob(I)alamin adenosyltransferase